MGSLSRLAVLSVLGAALGSSGCGETPLSVRYGAEKLLWGGRSLERRFWNNPETALAERSDAIRAYERVIEEFRPETIASDPDERMMLSRARIMAALGLSRLYVQGNEPTRAARVLYGLRDESGQDVDVGLRLHMDLIRVLQRAGQTDSLALVLREMTDRLPAASEDGTPIPIVLEAPLRLVELQETRGRAQEAAAELARAQSYFTEVAARQPNTDVEVAASIELAKVEIKQRRLQDAARTLERASTLGRSSRFAPTLIYSRGNLALQGIGDPRAAIGHYRELLARYPDDPNAPEAALQVGVAFSALGEVDSALAAFEFTERRFERAPNQAAQARLAGARMLSLEGRWPEALRRLRSLQSDYSRTPAGLVAPLELASYYERMGEAAASRTALESAVGDYERIIQEVGEQPEQRQTAMLALDHLAEVHERLRQWDRAVQILVVRADRFPADPKSVSNLLRAAAISEERLRDPAAAAELLERLATRYSDLPITQRARERARELRGTGS